MDEFHDDARTALASVRDDLKSHVLSLIVYGSVAKGEYRPGVSDINLVVVLEQSNLEILEAIGKPLRLAFLRSGVAPLILEKSEVPRLANSFPIKFLDIQRYGVAIHGENVFEGIEIEKKDIRTRIEQELRNHLLRLRRTYSSFFGAPDKLVPFLNKSIASLRIEIATLLELKTGNKVRTWQEIIAVSHCIDVNGKTLRELADWHDATNPLEPAPDEVRAMLRVLRQCIDAVEALEEKL